MEIGREQVELKQKIDDELENRSNEILLKMEKADKFYKEKFPGVTEDLTVKDFLEIINLVKNFYENDDYTEYGSILRVIEYNKNMLKGFKKAYPKHYKKIIDKAEQKGIKYEEMINFYNTRSICLDEIGRVVKPINEFGTKLSSNDSKKISSKSKDKVRELIGDFNRNVVPNSKISDFKNMDPVEICHGFVEKVKKDQIENKR